MKLPSLALLLASTLAAAPLTASAAPEDDVIILRTDVGDIGVELDWENAPLTARKFSRLVKSGALNGLQFFRIQEGFMIQTFEAKHKNPPPTPQQLAEIVKTPLENVKARHTAGSLSLGRPENDPNGGESSFSIMLVDTPHLDGKYTVFGRVVSGMETITALRRLPVTFDYQPLQPVFIRQALDSSMTEFQSARQAEAAAGAPGAPGTSWPLAGASAFDGLALVAGLAGGCWLAFRAGKPGLAQNLAAAGALAGGLILLAGAVTGSARSPLRGLVVFAALLALPRLLSRYARS